MSKAKSSPCGCTAAGSCQSGVSGIPRLLLSPPHAVTGDIVLTCRKGKPQRAARGYDWRGCVQAWRRRQGGKRRGEKRRARDIFHLTSIFTLLSPRLYPPLTSLGRS